MAKFSIITGFLGQTKDRFHTYNQPIDLDTKFRMVADIPGYDGVEVVYPYEVPDAGELKQLLKRYRLNLSAINVNVKGEPEFVAGGLTSPDKAVREKAIRFIKEGMDYAAAVGAPRVTCCPLGDGYEFVFQTDYLKAWQWLVEAFGEAAAHRPSMPLFIEYKPKETRRQCFLNRAADTTLLIKEIGAANLGVTMDYGHSIYAGEHPAQTLTTLHYSGVPYYIHINDNDKTWDWDFFTGSHTLLDYIEFIFYLKRFGYNDYLTTDSHPTRWDMKRMFEINSRMTQKIWSLLDDLGSEAIQAQIDDPDYMNTWQFIEEQVLSLR